MIFKSIGYGIVIGLVICIIYIMRATINRTSSRRLEFIIKGKFLKDKGGLKELENLKTNSVIVRRIQTIKNGNKVTANVSYKHDGIDAKASLLYRIEPVCSEFDPLCITV